MYNFLLGVCAGTLLFTAIGALMVIAKSRKVSVFMLRMILWGAALAAGFSTVSAIEAVRAINGLTPLLPFGLGGKPAISPTYTKLTT